MRRFAQKGWWSGGAQEASFSHACVTRAHSLQTCTFCFHNLHSRRHYSSLSFLTPRYFSVFSARLPWSIFRAVFSILGRKTVWSVKNVRKKRVSRCGWGSCNEICEGCESKKCKISVGARTRTRKKDVFRFIHRPLLAVVGGCCHTSMERGEREAGWFQIYLRCLAKNVGDIPKNVGDFLKNVGDFSENVGVFLWEVRSEWEEGRKVLQAQVRKSKSQCRAKGWNKRIVWSSRRKAVFLQGTRLRSLAE